MQKGTDVSDAQTKPHESRWAKAKDVINFITTLILVGTNQPGKGVMVKKIIPGAMPLAEFEDAIKNVGAR